MSAAGKSTPHTDTRASFSVSSLMVDLALDLPHHRVKAPGHCPPPYGIGTNASISSTRGTTSWAGVYTPLLICQTV